MEAHPGAVEAHPGAVVAHPGVTNELSRLPCATGSPVAMGVHPGAVLARPGSIEANTKLMEACPGSLQDHWGPRES